MCKNTSSHLLFGRIIICQDGDQDVSCDSLTFNFFYLP